MKIMSDTAQGGKVVELTQGEWSELKLLAQALDGKTLGETWNDVDFHRSIPDSFAKNNDYAGTFGAICAYAMNQFYINEMQHHLDRIKSYLKTKI